MHMFALKCSLGTCYGYDTSGSLSVPNLCPLFPIFPLVANQIGCRGDPGWKKSRGCLQEAFFFGHPAFSIYQSPQYIDTPLYVSRFLNRVLLSEIDSRPFPLHVFSPLLSSLRKYGFSFRLVFFLLLSVLVGTFFEGTSEGEAPVLLTVRPST